MKVVVCGEERTKLSWRENLGQIVIKVGSWLMSGKWPRVVNLQAWTREDWARQVEAYRREAEFADAFLRKWQDAAEGRMDPGVDLPPLSGHGMGGEPS